MFGSFGTTPAAPAPASTSLFGQTQPAQNQAQTPAGSSLFGTQQPAATGGMFGQPAQQQQQQGTGLFGSTTNQPQQQQQQSTGLFGSTTNQQSSTTGGGLFGSSQQPQQQPSTGGMFGSTTQPQPQQGGLFGSTNQQGGGMFGSTNNNQTNNNQQQGSLFGNTQQQQSGQFGNTTNNNLGSSTQPQQSNLWQSTIGGGTQELDIEAMMMKVKNSWDPASAEYKFKVSPLSTNESDVRRSCILLWIRGLRISMEDRGLMINYGRWLFGRTLILPRTYSCPSSGDDDHDADNAGEYP